MEIQGKKIPIHEVFPDDLLSEALDSDEYRPFLLPKIEFIDMEIGILRWRYTVT